MKETQIICACSNMEHQIMLWKDDSGDVRLANDIYIEIHLVTHRNFFKRLWYGLKYAFGYKCRYGCFDEFILDGEGIEKLKKFLQLN